MRIALFLLTLVLTFPLVAETDQQPVEGTVAVAATTESVPFISSSQDSVPLLREGDTVNGCVCRINCDPITHSCLNRGFGCTYEDDPFYCYICGC